VLVETLAADLFIKRKYNLFCFWSNSLWSQLEFFRPYICFRLNWCWKDQICKPFLI
jgi:hypothetical protein